MRQLAFALHKETRFVTAFGLGSVVPSLSLILRSVDPTRNIVLKVKQHPKDHSRKRAKPMR